MSATPNHIDRKLPEKKKINSDISNEFDEVTLFPDQLAKVNALIERLVAKPRDTEKINKQESSSGDNKIM